MSSIVLLIARQATTHMVLSALAYGFEELRTRHLKQVVKRKMSKLHRMNSTDEV